MLAADGDRLKLEPNQRVMIVGNTFAERMALYGYFETALYCAYPDHKLSVRNLGWSGDEVDLMPRPNNTGSFTENLKWHKADVIFLCFGMNESFAGSDGMSAWRDRLTKFVSELKAIQFNGKSAPKLILVSPIAHEDLGAPLPAGAAVVERNKILGEYTRVMGEVAKQEENLFIDLHAPMLKQMGEGGDRKMTINGIHLNELGYYHASREMAQSLGIADTDTDSGGSADGKAAELRRSVVEKNYFYHLCWRPLNPYYIWGGRAWCWADDTPMDELEQIGAVVRQRDEAIWNSAKPATVSLWSIVPHGPEIWERPVDCSMPGLPEKGKAPKMEEVRRNGARPKQ